MTQMDTKSTTIIVVDYGSSGGGFIIVSVLVGIFILIIDIWIGYYTSSSIHNHMIYINHINHINSNVQPV